MHKYTHAHTHAYRYLQTVGSPHTLCILNGQHHPASILGVHISVKTLALNCCEFKSFLNTYLLYILWQVPTTCMCLSFFICNMCSSVAKSTLDNLYQTLHITLHAKVLSLYLQRRFKVATVASPIMENLK